MTEINDITGALPDDAASLREKLTEAEDVLTAIRSGKVDALVVSGPQAEGFGLFSMRERLSLLGGGLEVTSAPGKGTIVVLTAPLEKRSATRPELTQAHHLPETTGISTPPTKRKAMKRTRVMLVDDHAVMRHGLSTLLSMHSDIETVGEASDGEEAVHMARELRPDVILMDISMPRKNGIEATRTIHAELPHICIVGLSMYDATDQATAMIQAGAVAYLSKSSGADALLATIHNRSM